MDRNREARRASIVGSNGFNRRRHRTNNLRGSPDEDGGLELQESTRLRDRVKKDRDRERERDKERERDRERERERDLRERSIRSKRRRGERLTSNRDDIGGDETSEDSVNDDEDEEDEETAAARVRPLTPAVVSVTNHHHHHGHVTNHHNHSHSSSFSQQHNSNNTSNIVSSNHHLQPRKSFPPSSSAKVLRAPPVWKAGDEMISVSVPRKARSASKRSHDWISSSSNNNSGGGVSGGEQNLGQAMSSPARQSVVSTSSPVIPNVVSTAAPSPAAPTSPSSSNASMRKKLKPNVNNSGPKLKPPKVSSKPSPSNPEELEIEIAEVLYGLMTQSQGPASKKEDSREINRLNTDTKSRHSSPISNSIPLSAVDPKRKKPRQIPENSSYGVRSSPVSAKPDTDQTPKSEISSLNLEKIIGSFAENGSEFWGNSVISQGQRDEAPPPAAQESAKLDLEMKPAAEEIREGRDSVVKEEMISPKETESRAVRAEDSNNVDSLSTATASSAATMLKTNSMAAEMENQKEEKFEIDLMAPPPQGRSSPDRAVKIDLGDSPVDQKPTISPIIETDLKAASVENREGENSGKDESSNEENKGKVAVEEAESRRNVNSEKPERDGGDEVHSAGNKLQPQSQKQQRQQMAFSEKSGHSTSSLPLPISMASWPGGLSHMGYMAPLQNVVSVDGGAVAPGHIQPLFSQPRPKRCATHCHIARNIHCLQQFMKMNPFWPPPAGSGALFGSKPCNLNIIPTGDMHGNVTIRGLGNSQDKAQSVSSVANHTVNGKGSQPATTTDSSQRKPQILIQQALPPVAPSNLLGPAFIFPLNQQQSAVTARSSGTKSPAGGASLSNPASSAVPSASPAPTAMSFNYQNMASNETQYLAILQNNTYPFPIAAPNYRGNPAQAMPLFNGSFYSSQMIHSSQIQHHQLPSVQASGSSLAQKQHLQGPQPQPPSGGSVSGGSASAGSLQNFSAHKTQPSQTYNQYDHSSRLRHVEGEAGSEDSPSTTDSRGSRASMNIYGQNFAMPIHPQNFALMTPPAALAGAAAAAAAMSTNSNQNDKKAHQLQQPGLKTGPEPLPPHGFAMSFGSINGASTGPSIDIASMTQNHAMFQSSSEAAARQNIQMMAAAQTVQKKSFQISDDGKLGGADSSTTVDDRNSFAGKALGGGATPAGQSIAFTRQDLVDGPVASMQANSVIEGSARSRAMSTSRPMTTNTMGAITVANAHKIQAQIQQQQMLQLKQQQQQHQQLAANRSKVPSTNNGTIYTEHLNSPPSMGTKFPNALSGFPRDLVQSNSSNSPNQSPQWRSAVRASTPQNSCSLASSTTTTIKNLPSRTQPQMHTQISFGGNQKPSAASQGQAPPPSNNQNPSSPMMVGSPTSSISKGASGSPRTSSASTNNKLSQASSLSAQPVKHPQSNPSQKSPSILGNPHIASSSSTGPKSQVQQQAQQQHPKTMQQAQHLFFSNPFAQSQSHSASMSSTTSGPNGYNMTRRRPDQHQQAPGGCPVSSAGGLSLCPPVTLSSTSTNDPATAIAAATASVKGGGLPSQGIIHAPQFGGQSAGTLLLAGFPYVHPIPAAVQVKPAEQKQPAGNDNLHPWQPEKK